MKKVNQVVILIICACFSLAGWIARDFAPDRIDTCRQLVLIETAKQANFETQMGGVQPIQNMNDVLRAASVPQPVKGGK